MAIHSVSDFEVMMVLEKADLHVQSYMQCSASIVLWSKFGYWQPGHIHDHRGALSHHLHLSSLILLTLLHSALRDSKLLHNCSALGLVAMPWEASANPAHHSKHSCAQLPSLPVPSTNLSPFVPRCYRQSRSALLFLLISLLVDGNEFCKLVSWLGFLDYLPVPSTEGLRNV